MFIASFDAEHMCIQEHGHFKIDERRHCFLLCRLSFVGSRRISSNKIVLHDDFADSVHTLTTVVRVA